MKPAKPTFRYKLRLAVASFAVLFVFVWPFAHHILAERIGFNPWKGFGFAMYCTPPPQVDLQVAIQDNQGTRLLPLGMSPAAIQLQVRQFRADRELWGKLKTPDSLAAGIRVWQPQAEAVFVRLRTLHFKAGEDRWVEQREDFKYEFP